MTSTPLRTSVATALRAASQVFARGGRLAYRLALTPDEYASLERVHAHGYDAGIFAHATEVDDDDQRGGVTLGFTEADAWQVRDAYDEDPDAFGALAPRSLRVKMLDFVDSIT